MGAITGGERHNIVVRFEERVDAQAVGIIGTGWNGFSYGYLVGDAVG